MHGRIPVRATKNRQRTSEIHLHATAGARRAAENRSAGGPREAGRADPRRVLPRRGPDAMVFGSMIDPQDPERPLPMAIRLKARSGESAEQMMRRFKKLCEKEGLTKDLKKRAYYEKPSERRQRAARKARKPMVPGGRGSKR